MMGIAYLLALIIYIFISIVIYKLIKKNTTKKWILKNLIAFFILLPTYDIIISNILKVYYCNFVELERINKKIDRPEVISIDSFFYKKEYAIYQARSYLHVIKSIQIKNKDSFIYEFTSKTNNAPQQKIDIKEVKFNKQAKYSKIYSRIELPILVGHFLHGWRDELIDTKTKEIISWSKGIGVKQYNFDIFGGFRGDRCSGSSGIELLEKTIKGDKDEK